MLPKLLIGSNTLCYLLNCEDARRAPGYIVRQLMFWYAHQKMFVRWGSSVSTKCIASHGVRKGGILSPFLCNVFMSCKTVHNITS